WLVVGARWLVDARSHSPATGRQAPTTMSKFIVIRKDLDLDPVVIESEGLTLGRLTGNDLAFDHPEVSGVHAAIEGADGDSGVFNRPEESCPRLNGAKTGQGPLAEGDVIQIGPYSLSLPYDRADLRVEVEMSSGPQFIAAPDEPSIEASNRGREG